MGSRPPPSAAPPIPGKDPQQAQFNTLRSQVETLTRTVQLQQQQIDRQAKEYERLHSQLDRVQEDVRQLPPVDRVSAAGFASKKLRDAELIPAPCEEDGRYDKAGCRDRESGCHAFDIGGQYRLMFNAANFDFHDATISNSQDTQNFFNQRFRARQSTRPRPSRKVHPTGKNTHRYRKDSKR